MKPRQRRVWERSVVVCGLAGLVGVLEEVRDLALSTRAWFKHHRVETEEKN